MKKLIVTAAVVCTAVFAHAAAANWKASASGMYNGTGSTADSALYSGTAYLFDAGVTSQEALYTLIEGGSTIGSSTAGYVATATFDSDGYFGGLNFSNGEQGGGSYTYYFVVINGDNAYFSNEKTVTANGTASARNVGFSSQDGSSALPVAGFQGAGKWSSTAVPEPTSGLLMLIGIAGLALRRKRA